MKIKTILVDDEQDGRETLRLALTRFCPEVELVAVCENADEGLAAIRQHQPELVFLDVQMPGKSGFDLLTTLDQIPFHVIFVTAHAHYAIKAIRFSALDYLLKPVDIDDLMKAIQRAMKKIGQPSETAPVRSAMENIRNHEQGLERLAIPTMEGITFIQVNEIVYCQSDSNYTRIILQGQPVLVVSRSLVEFEEMLSGQHFYRVHNSSLVNLKMIEKYIKGEGGYLVMKNGDSVEVSRRRKEGFLEQLNRL